MTENHRPRKQILLGPRVARRRVKEHRVVRHEIVHRRWSRRVVPVRGARREEKKERDERERHAVGIGSDSTNVAETPEMLPALAPVVSAMSQITSPAAQLTENPVDTTAPV